MATEPVVLEGSAFARADVFRALASEARLEIVRLLAERDRSLGELADLVSLNLATVSRHVQTLEAAGLVAGRYVPGAQGTQKLCRLLVHRVSLDLEPVNPETGVEESEMPIGLYTLAHVRPGCGMASRTGILGLADDPQAFLAPGRVEAELVWLSEGFLEYTFPNYLPTSVDIWRLDVEAEICSEAPDFDLDHPSDITVWINGVELATWISPSDFGGRRGRLNPAWWNDHGTQYGMLKTFSATPEGAMVDGQRAGSATVADLLVAPQTPVTVRIGIKPDARHPGGLNLFGKGFGNYPRDLVLRLHHRPHRSPSPRNADGVRALSSPL